MQVINGTSKPTATCTTKIDGQADVFTTFIAVGYNEADNTVKLVGNADLLTLSMALEIVSNKFKQKFSELSPEDQKAFEEIIRGGLL